MSDPSWGTGPPPGGGSIAPGEPPPGGPPPPPPLPWEDRQRLGFVTALVETVKLLVTAPGEAYARAKERGDYASPLLFAVLLAAVGLFAGVLYSAGWYTLFPPDLTKFRDLPAESLRWLSFLFSGPGQLVVFVVQLAFDVVFLFIGSGILHLMLMLVGGTDKSRAGFEGTFRSVGYSRVAYLALLVPFLGGLIAVGWQIVLNVVGLRTLHRTTTGKAVAAVLLPLAICCVCLIVLAFSFGALILKVLSNNLH